MRQWTWEQPLSTLTVISDPPTGTITVYKNDRPIFKRTNLTPSTVELIESHFLPTATKTPLTQQPYIE